MLALPRESACATNQESDRWQPLATVSQRLGERDARTDVPARARKASPPVAGRQNHGFETAGRTEKPHDPVSGAPIRALAAGVATAAGRWSCCFFSAGSGGYSARGPSQQLASWESGARRIRNTTVESKYLEHLREVHDPAAHVKTIEDELKGAIGKALGKQGQKILMYTRLMDQERRKHEEFLERLDGEGGADAECLEKELRECATAHNEYRKECLHARWELIVHRQAVGFIVGNHKYVQDRFPVADELPVTPSNDDDDGDGSSNETQKAKEAPKKFTDQLDWWSRIGRWK